MNLRREKQCRACEDFKTLSSFSGTSNTCKPCTVIRNRNYYRTKEGLTKGMFTHLKKNSVERNHVVPLFTKVELINWVNTHADFNSLYTSWVESDYVKDLKPSIDRLDSTKPYSFTNMRLTTWAVNYEAAYEERKSGKRVTRQCKTAIQLDLEGNIIKEYPSFANAARENNFCRTNINAAANTDKVAHGFRWKTGKPLVPNLPTPRDVR